MYCCAIPSLLLLLLLLVLGLSELLAAVLAVVDGPWDGHWEAAAVFGGEVVGAEDTCSVWICSADVG